MSSLAAVQADGFYYPPGWDPSQGSVSKAAGSKGSNQYEQYGVIRFELPYNCWCEGCGRPLGKGTRFNAKKEEAGKYYTTKIWAFSMKCPSCSNNFIIKTDPKNSDYEFAVGIRRKEQSFAPEDAEVTALDDDATKEALATNPMYRLEHAGEDLKRAQAKRTRLSCIEEWSEITRGDDYAANSALRRAARGERKETQARTLQAQKMGLGIKLLPHTAEDSMLAANTDLGLASRVRAIQNQERTAIAKIHSSSIFAKKSGKKDAKSNQNHEKLTAAAMRIAQGGFRLRLTSTNPSKKLAGTPTLGAGSGGSSTVTGIKRKKVGEKKVVGSAVKSVKRDTSSFASIASMYDGDD